jgi:hypothetical protein
MRYCLLIIGFFLCSGCTVTLDSNYFVGNWKTIEERVGEEKLNDEISDAVNTFNADGVLKIIEPGEDDARKSWTFHKEQSYLIVEGDSSKIVSYNRKQFTIYFESMDASVVMKRTK